MLDNFMYFLKFQLRLSLFYSLLSLIGNFKDMKDVRIHIADVDM